MPSAFVLIVVGQGLPQVVQLWVGQPAQKSVPFLAAAHVPEEHRAVVAARGKGLTVRSKGERRRIAVEVLRAQAGDLPSDPDDTI